MLVLPRRSAKMCRRRRRRIQVEAATYYLSLGSYYYVLPPSPARHAYEPVLCIISFPWSMHVCHLNTTPSIPITYMHPTIGTCKKHRLETTRLADSSSRSAPLHLKKKKTCQVDSHSSRRRICWPSFIFGVSLWVNLHLIIFNVPFLLTRKQMRFVEI